MMNVDEKKTEKIYPSELGIWVTCRKKWLFDYMKRKKKLPSPPSSGLRRSSSEKPGT